MSGLTIEQQEERRKLFNINYISKMMAVFTEDAKYIGNEGKPGYREIVWHCMVLLREGYIKKANSILRNVKADKCHFLPMNFTQILYKYGKVLDRDVIEKLKEYIISSLQFMKSERIHISMYNDNFANMAIYTCIIAGEMFGDAELFNIGYNKLLEVKDQFSRCGVLMEYGSPTYTPIDTCCFAEIANHVKDDKTRKLALKCEKRMMIEIATHYHSTTSLMAGPYSRAYAIDMMGHPHILSGLHWLLFGDSVFVNPINYLFKPLKKQMMHGGLEGLTLPNLAWILDCDYHIDKKLIDLALNKRYPYNVQCITECIPSNVHENPTDDSIHEYGGYRGTNTTYMTKNFSLGTCNSQFHGGALSESFYITYKNCDTAAKLEDVGVIYSRYVFNNQLPEQTNTYEIFGKVDSSAYRDEGRKFCLQKQGEALVIYKPKQYERKNIKSARLQLMIPIHFNENISIYINSKKVDKYPYEVGNLNNIYITVNNSYFAFVPLEITNHGRKKAISVEKVNNHIIISLYNYEGENRAFGIRELLLTCSGFVTICKDKSEYSSFEEFIQYVNKGKISDVMEVQEGAASRKVKYKNTNIELNFMYSPITEGIFIKTIDKKPIDMNILKADGLNNRDIPFV